MSTKNVIGGIASEYDDQILWIERPEVGAAAAQIVDEREYTPCEITKIVSRDDYDSEEAYSAASDELLNESTAACTGEFITMDGVFFEGHPVWIRYGFLFRFHFDDFVFHGFLILL